MSIIRLYCLSVLVLIYSPFLAGQVVPSYPDNSLTLENYAEIGIPSPNHTWTVTDYKVAIKYLRELHKEDRAGLPRAESLHSQVLFERMVNISNFQFLLDKSIPLQERYKSFGYIVNVPNELIQLYIEPSDSVQRNGAEVLSIIFFSMEQTVLAFNFLEHVKEELPHLAKNDDFMIMYESIEESIGNAVVRSMDIVEKQYTQYDHKVLETFTTKIINWLPNIKQHIKVTAKEKLVTQSQFIKKTHPNKAIKKSMKTLKKQLR